MQKKSHTLTQARMKKHPSHPSKQPSLVPTSYDCRLLALPLEVLQEILSLDSLSMVLVLSSGCRCTVISHGAYPLLSTHLLESIRALRLTGLSSTFTFSHLLTALYTSQCSLCSNAIDPAISDTLLYGIPVMCGQYDSYEMPSYTKMVWSSAWDFSRGFSDVYIHRFIRTSCIRCGIERWCMTPKKERLTFLKVSFLWTETSKAKSDCSRKL